MELSPDQIEHWTNEGLRWSGPFLKALLVLALGWFVSSALYSRTIRLIQARGLDLTLGRFLAQLARWTLLGATFIAALNTLGVEVMGLVAVFASAGVAIGLALQGNLSNFASGVMILVFRPFDVGDAITAAGHTGAVHEIGLFSTTLHTPDGLTILVPNSAITGGVIVNLTRRTTRRAVVRVGVAYGTDASRVMEVLRAAAAGVDRVLLDPSPEVAFANLGGSSIDFDVAAWCAAADVVAVQGALRLAVYEALSAEAIEIPFPQIVVHQATA